VTTPPDRLASLPTASGGLSRLAANRLRRADIRLEPLLSRVGLTIEQIDDPERRVDARRQIAFLETAAKALNDVFLGLSLAEEFDCTSARYGGRDIYGDPPAAQSELGSPLFRGRGDADFEDCLSARGRYNCLSLVMGSGAPNMTSQSEASKHVTPEMCAVLRYTGEHGCMAKIGEPWLGPARLLEHQGLIVLWRCLGGHYAARLTPAGAQVLSAHGERARKVLQFGVTSI
jgi:Arabinose-binding domain of AraC transcription regulator, N-term